MDQPLNYQAMPYIADARAALHALGGEHANEPLPARQNAGLWR